MLPRVGPLARSRSRRRTRGRRDARRSRGRSTSRRAAAASAVAGFVMGPSIGTAAADSVSDFGTRSGGGGVADVDADVCIIGAGFAGLTAARHLTAGGQDDHHARGARSRRRPGVDRARRPTARPSTSAARGSVPDKMRRTHWPPRSVSRRTRRGPSGETVLVGSSGVKRYSGSVPNINPISIASLSARDDPARPAWRGRFRSKIRGTRRTRRSWDHRVSGAGSRPSRTSRRKKRTTSSASVMRGLWTSDPSEVSLLHALYLIRSADGLNRLLEVEGGYQQDRVTGGAHGDRGERGRRPRRLDRSSRRPHARSIRTRPVSPSGARASRSALQHVIVAIPPSLAGHLHLRAAAAERSARAHRAHAGGVDHQDHASCTTRRSGAPTGCAANRSRPSHSIEMTLDASPESGMPGVLAAFAFGPYAPHARGLRRRRTPAVRVGRTHRAVRPDGRQTRVLRGAGLGRRPLVGWVLSRPHAARACSPSSDARSERRSGASTGPVPRPQRCRTAPSTARSDPAPRRRRNTRYLIGRARYAALCFGEDSPCPLATPNADGARPVARSCRSDLAAGEREQSGVDRRVVGARLLGAEDARADAAPGPPSAAR